MPTSLPQPSSDEPFSAPSIEEIRWDLAPLLNPRSIAIVGASETSFFSSQLMQNLRHFAFEGDIYPVNPKYEEVAGIKCYPSLETLPAAPDNVAIIVVFVARRLTRRKRNTMGPPRDSGLGPVHVPLSHLKTNRQVDAAVMSSHLTSMDAVMKSPSSGFRAENTPIMVETRKFFQMLASRASSMNPLRLSCSVVYLTQADNRGEARGTI